MGSDNGAKTATLDSGLPALTEGEKKAAYGSVLFGGLVVPLAVGAGIAYAVYTLGPQATYDKRIKVLVGNEQHWVALAIVVLGRMVAFVNFYPMILKGRVMRGSSGNLRSNPFIYKAIGKDAKENAIVFIDDGEVGAYNRANRSLHHLIENYGALVAGLFLAGSVFAFPVFVATVLFAVGRVAHQVGYTSGYGGHGLGYALALVAISTIEGMLLIVGLKGLKMF